MNSRILFCFPTNSVYGGVEQWLADLCVGLGAEGADIVLAPARGLRFHIPEQYFDFHQEMNSFRKIDIDGTLGIPKVRKKSLSKIIDYVQPDILVPVLLYDALSAAVGIKGNKKPRIIYPAHENSLNAFRMVNHFRSGIDAVVSVNRLFLDALSAWYDWPVELLHHIRCGVPLPKSRRNADDRGVLRIGYCGKLTDRPKKVRDLVVISRQLRANGTDFELTIVGDGPEELFLKTAFREESELKKICFLGRRTRDQLYREFYPTLDVLIIMSEWETGPMVAWEAMQHGVVPVTSRYRGLSAEGLLNDDVNCRIFPIGEPVVAADKISEMARNRALFDRLSTHAVITAKKFLSMDTMTGKWIELIQEISRSSGDTRYKTGPVGNSKKQFDSLSIRERMMNLARWMMNRPYWHGSSHLEWPPYLPISEKEQESCDFDERLRSLETQRYPASG